MNLASFMSYAPSITAQTAPMGDKIASDANKDKKEGIAKMLSGLGKGNKDENFGLRPLPQQQGIDVQSFLASLFGG